MQGFKVAVKASMASMLSQTGISLAPYRGKVLILAYHRVLREADLCRRYVEPGMYVTDHVFEMHMRWLVEHFQIVSFADLLGNWRDNYWDPKALYCVITFDDGWLDNYLYAFPVLRQLNVPATIFLPTNYIGSTEWFWPDKLTYLLASLYQPYVAERQRAIAVHAIGEFLGGAQGGVVVVCRGIVALKSFDKIVAQCKLKTPNAIEGMLNRLSEILELSIPAERLTVNWSEIGEMATHGVSFGSHSCSHHLLSRLSKEIVLHELEESNRLLRAMPSGYVPIFCYPNGDNNRMIQELVMQSQYVAAVGTKAGLESRRPRNLFELNRIGIHNDVSRTVPLLSFHLLRSVLGV